MSANSRCHDCKHKRGPRSTAPMAKADKGHGVQPKKAPCGCQCHQGDAA